MAVTDTNPNVAGNPALAVPSNVSNNPQLSVQKYLTQQISPILNGQGTNTGPTPASIAASLPSQPQVSVGQQLPGQQGISDDQQNQDALMTLQLAAAKRAQVQQPTPTGLGSTPAGQVYTGGSKYGNGTSTYKGPTFNAADGLSAARNEALNTAESYLGDRYQLGGTTHAGIDCSGLVMAVYDQLGYGQYLNSHLAGHQAAAIPGVRTSIANLRPGDLVAWADGSHIAIYAGNGMIIAAAAPGEGVKYQPVWGNVYGIALRLPGE